MVRTAGPDHPGGQPPIDKVRRLQRKLYEAAKRNPERRFHVLYDGVHRSDVLWEAWSRFRWNKGAAGVDGITLEAVEQYGVGQLLAEMADALHAGRCRPPPVPRRHYVHERLAGFMMRRAGRNRHAGRAQPWDGQWFWDHGLHRFRGTIRYPKPCMLHEKTLVEPCAGCSL